MAGDDFMFHFLNLLVLKEDEDSWIFSLNGLIKYFQTIPVEPAV